MTAAQRAALDWLAKHNGDGTLDRNGIVLAAGETAPFTRATWNGLRDLGRVEFYRLSPKGYGRIRLAAAARSGA
jgi:hypothetical protein